MDDVLSLTLPYNGTIPTGGDSLTQNLNVYYEVSILLPSTIITHADMPSSSPATSPGCSQPPLSFCSWSLALGKSTYIRMPSHRPYSSSSQVLLLRPGTPKVSLVPGLGHSHGCRRNVVSMVLLGLLTRILPFCRQIHWRSYQYWLP